MCFSARRSLALSCKNHATNNTLLVLRYFYQSSPFKLERVLNSLLEVELSIGLRFDQQVREASSVPDAVIRQEPLTIVVEAYAARWRLCEQGCSLHR